MSVSRNIVANRAGAILTVDLGAIADNYRLLRDMVAPATCAGVVKANAYGLGIKPVAETLWDAGCRVFFVVTMDEAIELREVLEEAEIHVLTGAMRGAEEDAIGFGMVPVLNSLHDIKVWKQFQKKVDLTHPVDIQVDSGMTRAGLSPAALDIMREDPAMLEGLSIRFVMSHLACADDIKHRQNQQQLDAFHEARIVLPFGKASLANSSGIFHGAGFHFDVTRPGCALYGVNPTPHTDNPMKQVVHLQAKVLQIHDITAPRAVGYSATHKTKKGQRIATIASGYADGYLRSLSGSGVAYVDGIACPVAGRVSMDLISLDVTDVPENRMHHGTLVDLIGPFNPVDDVANRAGTIGYEILTSLGHRYHRCYVNGPSVSSDLEDE